MNDNVKILFPDLPSEADPPSTAEVMAQNLEGIAAKIRSGELQIQYGTLAVMKINRCVANYAIGDSTFHQSILLADLSHALEMKRLLHDG